MRFPRLWALDFDGVLVDSYSCLPAVYRRLAEALGLSEDAREKFVATCMRLEDEFDARQVYDRRALLKRALSELSISVPDSRLEELVELYWRERIARTVVRNGVVDALQTLNHLGVRLVILCGNDGERGRKRARIISSGLSAYFDEIIVVGDDVPSRIEALKSLMRRHSTDPSETIVVDDKPAPLNEIAPLRVLRARVRFEGPLRLAWMGHCDADFEVDSLPELVLRLLLRAEL